MKLMYLADDIALARLPASEIDRILLGGAFDEVETTVVSPVSEMPPDGGARQALDVRQRSQRLGTGCRF